MEHVLVHLNRRIMASDKSGAFHYSVLPALERKEGTARRTRGKGPRYTQSLVLENVQPVVLANRVATIQAKNSREVFAWFDGYTSDVAADTLRRVAALTINPHRGETVFHAIVDGVRKPVTDETFAGCYVTFGADGAYLCVPTSQHFTPSV
jgi:hypothetical protein